MPNGTSIKTLINLFLQKESRDALFKNKFIKQLLNKKNSDLSGGEKRIVEILLMNHSEADFILLDKPFNGVSPIIRE